MPEAWKQFLGKKKKKKKNRLDSETKTYPGVCNNKSVKV